MITPDERTEGLPMGALLQLPCSAVMYHRRRGGGGIVRHRSRSCRLTRCGPLDGAASQGRPFLSGWRGHCGSPAVAKPVGNVPAGILVAWSA